MSGGRVGILTKTVVPSPVVRWLVHVRLRHGRWNDVVFVTSNFIKVYNIGVEGHLQHIATKDDFDAQIRAARVFDINHPLGEDHLLESDGESCSGSRITPPQLLVLSLGSNELLFLYLAQDGAGSPRFVQQTCPLPSFPSILSQPGEHLAVDPLSRAVAVAAPEREIVIYSAKTGKRISHELSSEPENWCPVSSQRPLQIEGVVQHMEFLTPPSDDEDHVILLLIVVDHQRRTKAVWIDWRYDSDLHHAQMHPAQPLDATPSVSSLLIPLQNAAFMIVNGSEVKLWTGLLSGAASGAVLKSLIDQPRNPGDSPRRPIWTSWCRPRRSQAARREKDHIYLAREDGLVCLAEVRASGQVVSSLAGDFRCHVGTAFASLGGPQDPDILAVAGDMSSGRIVSIGHWPTTGARVSDLSWDDTMKMDLIETIPNWASVTDMIALTPRHSRGRAVRASDGIFVTSGRQPFGTVTELRRGLEARLSSYFEAEGLRNTTGLWSLSVATLDSTIIFMTSPSGSRIFSISADSGVADLEVDEIGEEQASALDLSHRTLTVAATPDEHIVQVTERGVRITASLMSNFEDTLTNDCQDDQKIIAASVDVPGSMIVTAEQMDGDFYLRCVHFAEAARNNVGKPSDVGPEMRKPLKSEPLAVATIQHNEGTLAAVATADSKLRFFLATSEPLRIREVFQTDLHSSGDVQSTCDSVVLLRRASGSRMLALCGLRDGRICSLELEVNEQGELAAGETQGLRIGHSAVKLVHMAGSPADVFATSSAEFCQISWTGDDGASLSIHHVWVSDKLRPELDQGPMVACTRILASDNLATPQIAGSLILISGDDFMITSLESAPTTVPRQIGISGTPNRLIYAEQQRCLVCTSVCSGVRQFPTPSSRPEERRQAWPVIDFIPSRSNGPSFTHIMQPGERVFALLEWSYKVQQDDKEKIYSFVLVGGSYASRSGVPKGKITFLQPTNETWTVVDVKESKSTLFDAPVYALALYDELTYVVCYGQFVQLFKFVQNHWTPLCEPLKLASAALYVTTDKPLIYVSTAKDSHVTLQLSPRDDQDEATTTHRLVPSRTAPRADCGLSHLIVERSRSEHASSADGIALMSTQDTQILGLTSPAPNNDNNNNNTTPRPHSRHAQLLFEAQLPYSLTRLRRCDIRPAWKPAPLTGVIADDIVGSAADGTVLGIALLHERLWRRLFWLQRLCEWDPEISPHSYETPDYCVAEDDRFSSSQREERAVPAGLGDSFNDDDDDDHDDGGDGERWEIPLQSAATRLNDMHIDGDVLARVLENGDGAGRLQGILRRAADREDGVGRWVKEHLHGELGEVDGIVAVLRRLLYCWL